MKITLFAQILQIINRDSFKKLVSKHKANKHCKGNSTKSKSPEPYCSGLSKIGNDICHSRFRRRRITDMHPESAAIRDSPRCCSAINRFRNY